MDKLLDTVDKISGVLIGLTGTLTTVGAWILGRRQREADTEKTKTDVRKIEIEITDLAVQNLFRLINELQEQLSAVHNELALTRKETSELRLHAIQQDAGIAQIKLENKELRRGISILIAQVRGMNLIPAWEPQEK